MATISQKVVFKETKKESLYDLYMNAKKHSEATGSPAKITEKEGSSFSAFDGYIVGKNLMIVKDQLIVQLWRGSDWAKKDPDSVFMLSLEQKGKDALLNMVHANVPEKQVDDLAKGWRDFYWKPWKKFLTGKRIKRPEM